MNADDHSVHIWSERHTTRALYSADHVQPNVRVTAAQFRTNGGCLSMWVVMLCLLGGYNPSVTALTPNLCAFSGQSDLVVATGAKKGLFANLKKLERILLAPPTVNAQTVDVVVIGQQYQRMGLEVSRATELKCLPSISIGSYSVALHGKQHEPGRKNGSAIFMFGVHSGAHH